MKKKVKFKIIIMFIVINIVFLYNISYAKYTIVKNLNAISIKIYIEQNDEMQNE